LCAGSVAARISENDQRGAEAELRARQVQQKGQRVAVPHVPHRIRTGDRVDVAENVQLERPVVD